MARLTQLCMMITLAAPMAMAQENTQTDMHAGHDMTDMSDMGEMPADADNQATAAYAAINAEMHEAMNIPFTGNADVDFVAGMIPHHQGAVDMARIVLNYGTDPEVRAFAEAVIAAQEAEIKWMTEWLAANPVE